MDIFLFDSHSLDQLAEELSERLERGIFSHQLLIIPHHSMKEWLQLKLCKEGIVGLEFATPRQALQKFISLPSRAEIASLLWHLVPQVDECKPFLKTEKGSLDFVQSLSSLFFEYTEYGFPKTENWQKKLYDQVIQPISWEIPSNPPTLYLFGLDILPPATLQYFLNFPSVQIFRFSPCAMFWEDFCSIQERKRVLKKAPAHKRAALDSFLKDSHPLLSNWGKAARKILPLYPEPVAENYSLQESSTLLDNLKLDLLLSEEMRRETPFDPSLRALQTGSSPLREIQVLRREILSLGIPFSNIRVYAPDIGPYAPLIEYCFADIPFRIGGLDLVRRSPYYQALSRIFSLVDRWSLDLLLELFEMPVFYRTIPCSSDEIERIAQWIRRFRNEELLDSLLFFEPEKEFVMNWSDADLFERFHDRVETLKGKVLSWKTERTLKEWADEIEHLPFLEKELLSTLESLRKSSSTEKFPLSFVQKFFFSFSSSEMGASKLHAIRFNSLETGAILPAEAIFVLGMSEEAFPRSETHSSLRLPSGSPTRGDKDRYLFLNLIFAAKKHLIFTYQHRSIEDGKEVSPSLLIQELFGYLKNGRGELATLPPPVQVEPSLFSNSRKIPERAPISQVSVGELTRFLKNPFLYALELDLREETASAWEEFELSSLTRHLILRSFLEEEKVPSQPMPLGLFGDLARQNLEQEKAGFKRNLQKWGIESVESLKIDREIGGVRLFGEVHFSTPQGALHMGGDEIGALLRRWAEILIVLTETNSNKIYCLKSGRVREVGDPEHSLKEVLDLYCRSQESPLFLHPEWADSLLRKNRTPEKMEDRGLLWAMRRSVGYDLKMEKGVWSDTLKRAFSSLIALYPTKGGDDATV